MYCNVLPLLLAPMIQLLHRCLVFLPQLPLSELLGSLPAALQSTGTQQMDRHGD